jgi:hypothetical protein
MEPFVQKITGGGGALVAGLWLATLADGLVLSGLGWGLVLLGVVGLGLGIGEKVER